MIDFKIQIQNVKIKKKHGYLFHTCSDKTFNGSLEGSFEITFTDSLKQELDWYIIPNINPDGYNYSYTDR